MIRHSVYLICVFLLLNGLQAHAVESQTLRDPTRPLGHIVVQRNSAALNLQAVLDHGNGKEAIISGQRVKVGDRIGKARIVKIEEKAVVYSVDGVNRRLSLRQSVYGK